MGGNLKLAGQVELLVWSNFRFLGFWHFSSGPLTSFNQAPKVGSPFRPQRILPGNVVLYINFKAPYLPYEGPYGHSEPGFRLASAGATTRLSWGKKVLW